MKRRAGVSALATLLVAGLCFLTFNPQGPAGLAPAAAQDSRVPFTARVPAQLTARETASPAYPVITTAPLAGGELQTILVGRSPQAREIEAKIFAALDSDTEFRFFDTPLNEVMDYLEARHGINIEINEQALGLVGLDSSQPVTRDLKGVSLRAALTLVLDQYDLTYDVRDEVLLITTRADAQATLDTRIYGGTPFAQLSAEDFQSLIGLITSTIEPQSWQDAGGMGRVSVFAPSGALIVTQTPQAQAQIESLLRQLIELDASLRAAAPPA